MDRWFQNDPFEIFSYVFFTLLFKSNVNKKVKTEFWPVLTCAQTGILAANFWTNVQTFSALQILSNFFLLDFEKDLWESVVVATKTPERSFFGAWVLVKSGLVDH